MITLIAAHDRNGAIGKDGTIPWEAPEDLSLFGRETRGGAIIMGRKTWESLPMRPLKGRLNIVVTSNADLAEHTAASVNEAVEMAVQAGHFRIYGIGGQSIYRDLLPKAHRLLLTRVEADTQDADAFFPRFDQNDWHLLATRTIREMPPVCEVSEYLRSGW